MKDVRGITVQIHILRLPLLYAYRKEEGGVISVNTVDNVNMIDTNMQIDTDLVIACLFLPALIFCDGG